MMNIKEQEMKLLQSKKWVANIVVQFFLIFLLHSLLRDKIFAQQISMAPKVNVEYSAGNWLIKGQKVEVSIAKDNLQMKIKTATTEWEMNPSDSNDFVIAADSFRVH